MCTYICTYHVLYIICLLARNRATCMSAWIAMSSTGRTHSLCASVISSHHLSLFSISSINNKWPSRIQDLLDVNISIEDGLPPHIHSVCKKRVEVLEKAASIFRNKPNMYLSSCQKGHSNALEKPVDPWECLQIRLEHDLGQRS